MTFTKFALSDHGNTPGPGLDFCDLPAGRFVFFTNALIQTVNQCRSRTSNGMRAAVAV